MYIIYIYYMCVCVGDGVRVCVQIDEIQIHSICLYRLRISDFN